MNHEKKTFNPASVNTAKNKKLYKQYFEGFYIFRTHFETVAYEVCSLADLHKYIIQPNIPDKKKKHWITPNFHLNLCKTKITATPSNFVLLDVDLKTPAQLIYAQSTFGGTTLQQTLSIMIDAVKGMKECMFLDISTSDKGFHAIFHVVSDYWQENMHRHIQEEYLKEIKRQNFECVFTKLKTLGFRMCGNKKVDYIDPAMDSVTQGLYSSNGKGYYINSDADLFAYVFDRTKLPSNNSLGTNYNIPSGQTLSINDEYTALMMEYRLSISGDTALKGEYRNLIKMEMSHYNIGIIHSVKHCNADSIDYWAEIYAKWYEGSSVPRTRAEFIKFINIPKLPNIVPLSVLLPDLSMVLYRYKQAKMAKLPPSLYDSDIIPFRVLNMNEYDIRKSNDVYINQMVHYFKTNKGKKIFDVFKKDFFGLLVNPSIELLVSLKMSNAYVIKLMYKHTKANCTNKHLIVHLKDYNTFWHYLQTLDCEFKLPLNFIFKYVDMSGRDYYTLDALDNPYDETVTVKNGHITQDIKAINRLNSILDEYNFVALKGPAGIGKSTYLYGYIDDLFNGKENFNIAIVSPINGLLMQMIHQLKNKYPHLNIIKNYGKDRVNNKLLTTGCNLICSSTPKLELIDHIDLIIIDEIDKLENYSGTISSNFDRSIRLIVTSATIESWLIYEKDYYYVNIMKEDFVKPKMNIIYSNEVDKSLYTLFDPNRLQLIYENNNDSLEKRREYIKGIFNYECDIVYADLAKSENVINILENQMLRKSTLSSNWIGAGVNLLNTGETDIIIIDHNFKFSEVYQMSQRFRVADKTNIYLIHKFMRRYKAYDDFTFYNKELYDYDKFLKKKQVWIDHLDNIKISYDSVKYANYRSYKGLIHNNIYVENIHKELVLNEDALKKEVYDEVIFKPFTTDRRIFEKAYWYYFNLNIREDVHDEKLEKFNEKARTDWFMENHDRVISVFSSMSAFNEDLYGGQIISDEIFLKNMAYYRKLFDRAMEINRLKLGYVTVGDKEILRDYKWYLGQIVMNGMHYTKFINSLRKEVINGICDRDEIDDKIVLKHYNKRGDFFRYIHKKGLHRVNSGETQLDLGTKYLIVEDIVKCLKNEVDLDADFMSKNFHDIETKTDWFTINEESIGMFLGTMGSFYRKENRKVRTGKMIPEIVCEFFTDDSGMVWGKWVTKMRIESVQRRIFIFDQKSLVTI